MESIVAREVVATWLVRVSEVLNECLTGSSDHVSLPLLLPGQQHFILLSTAWFPELVQFNGHIVATV